MGIFDRFRRRKRDKAKVREHGPGSGPVSDDRRPLPREEAQRLQNAFHRALDQSNITDQVHAASDLLNNGLYTASIEAFTTLLRKYPAQGADFESQIGAAYYLLGRYAKAIDHYAAARDHGADREMIDYNIWKACEAQYQQTNNTVFINRYLALCPNGNYIEDARRLLS